MSIEVDQGYLHLHSYGEVLSGKNCERCGEFFSWKGHPGVIVEHDCLGSLMQRVRALEALQRPSETPQVEVVVLPSGEGLSLPSYATRLSAGADLRAAEGALIQPGTRRLIGTGLSFRIPEGYERTATP